MPIQLSRREFLGASAALAAVAAGRAPAAPAPSPAALIGCGGRGRRILHAIKGAPDHRAWILCDPDDGALTAANAIAPGIRCSDWQAALHEYQPGSLVLAAPASVNARVLAALPPFTSVYCDGLLASSAAETRALLTTAARVDFALHPRHPWHAHGEEAARLIGAGALGELRWSQLCVAPVSLGEDPRESLSQHVFTALQPLFRATGAGIPLTVRTIGTTHPRASGLPEAFTTEYRFDDGHTMLLHCSRANTAGLLPVVRGTRASLEFHADHLALISHAPAQGIERFSVHPETPLTRWQTGNGTQGAAEWPCALHAQLAACLALDDFAGAERA